ncbi:thioredoxin family protein [Aquimarina sp. 2201CG1-2-11]|uniref:thioredoxin family protein n=1 Tax=Aquimarina discodermiae TaxID=3231043 RepID=UPI003462DD3A
MKNLFLLLFFSFSIAYAQQKQQDVTWLQDFDKAKSIAKKKNKKVLLYFSGSDWCAPCKMLKKDFFENDKFKKYTSSFVLMLVDIPRNRDLLTEKQREQNAKLLEQYNTQKSFPLVTIIDTKGKVIDKISGYNSLRDPKFHFELLDKLSK